MTRWVCALVCCCVPFILEAGERLSFKNGKFKIAQITDVHWDQGSPNCERTITSLRAVFEAERPDMAMLTGDIVTAKRTLETLDYREEFGFNFDPSHLIWQGMDPVACIRELGKENAIFHFHAKDTRVDKYNTAINGVLDTRPYGDEINRSWIFRSCGYGNDSLYWKDIISALRMVGYDYAISIEHEDSLMSQNEGLSKAVEFLKGVITFEDKMTAMWWA